VSIVKLLHFTDVHYSQTAPESRAEEYKEDIKAKMLEILAIETKLQPAAVLFGGDLYHRKQNVTHLEVGIMINIFKEFSAPIYGIVGSHDVTGHQVLTIDHKPAGVLEAAGVIEWISPNVKISPVKGVSIGGAPCHAGYEEDPKSYGVGVECAKKDVLVWLSHGVLVRGGKKLIYDHTDISALEQTRADILINGHYHSETWVQTAVDGRLFLNPGSVGRTDIQDMHEPCVTILAIDTEARTWKHKFVKLKSARPYSDVFEAKAAPAKKSDAEITEFVEALEKESGDVRTEDLQEAIGVGCKGKPKNVKPAISARLGV